MTVVAGSGRAAPAPIRYRAQVRCGDRLLADSLSAVAVERPEDPPELLFPAADVDTAALVALTGRVERPGLGPARPWGLAGRIGAVAWTIDGPAPAAPWAVGMTAFAAGAPADGEKGPHVRIELLDGAVGADPRDVTVKRYPVWGDVDDLLDILDLRPVGPDRFRSVTRPSPRRPVVEGSQMLGQAIVAAGRLVPGRRLVSGHMVFHRAADTGRSLDFVLEPTNQGRTFATLGVGVIQGDRCCATGSLLLDVTADDVIGHQHPPPPVVGPYDAVPHDMSVMGRDVRVVDGAYTNDPAAPAGPPVIDAWVRFRDLPDDGYLHAALLAQFTGHMSIAAALRPHAGVSQSQAHQTLSTAINAITLSLHGPVQADRWMLYHHESTFAGAGMTHSTCRVHDGEGRLLASFSVDAMVRRFAGGGQGDARTSL